MSTRGPGRTARRVPAVVRAARLVRTTTAVVIVGVLGVAAVEGGASLGSASDPAASDTAASSSAVAGVSCGVDQPSAGDDTKAVVRTPTGRLRVVSFEQGWAVYTGRQPGTFVGVCVR